MRPLLAACIVVALALPARAETDLRDIGVGMTAATLPAGEYTGFRCADPPGTPLGGWTDWQSCPADAQGRHAVRFAYADGKTVVAGHPVVLTALFGAGGRLEVLTIETDPAARLFMRKRAFLLGLQARAHFGDDGWACTEGHPGPDAEPLGGVFIRETCRKSLPGRDLLVERALYRKPGTELQDFVGESRVTITARAAP